LLLFPVANVGARHRQAGPTECSRVCLKRPLTGRELDARRKLAKDCGHVRAIAEAVN
jgi:hypothetical protein